VTEARRHPQRTCLGCREVKDQADLVRVVCSPDGEVLVDLKGKLPGRGAYLCNSRRCAEDAVKRKQFDRAFKRSCRPVDADQLVDAMLDGLLMHMASLLGMARKSATFVAGSNAVLDALGHNRSLAVIVLAEDISPQIAEKVRYKAGQKQIVTVDLFKKIELGRILGRAERSVVGLPAGKLADAFLKDLLRYQDISGES